MTRRLFRHWRRPRYGRSNPERMNNPVWEWLVRSRATAYALTQRLSAPSALKAGPGWCFCRNGQSETTLPDGRRILVGGEHEDAYDPDFFIYNDVVVLHPDRRIDIFGYPRDLFPPTDFHSATLVGGKIFIIGCLGYPEDRQAGMTPVFRLDVNSFAISRFDTAGPGPGWLHEHTAELAPGGGAITVRGGRLESARNINDWRLRLDTGVWENLTNHRWQVWEVRRQDGALLHLWQIRSQLMLEKLGHANLLSEQLRRFHEQFEIPTLQQELGGPIDAEAASLLFRPPVHHEPLPDDPGQFSLRRIRLNGVMVRYEERVDSIEVTFEGELPQTVTNAIIKDLETKLARLERTACTAKRL